MPIYIDPEKARKAYGTLKAWSEAIGVGPTTISSWLESGSVPHWRFERVAAQAKIDGKDIFSTEEPKPRPRKPRAEKSRAA